MLDLSEEISRTCSKTPEAPTVLRASSKRATSTTKVFFPETKACREDSSSSPKFCAWSPRWEPVLLIPPACRTRRATRTCWRESSIAWFRTNSPRCLRSSWSRKTTQRRVARLAQSTSWTSRRRVLARGHSRTKYSWTCRTWTSRAPHHSKIINRTNNCWTSNTSNCKRLKTQQ